MYSTSSKKSKSYSSSKKSNSYSSSSKKTSNNIFEVFENRNIDLKIYAFIPIGIQGCGKSYIYDNVIYPLLHKSKTITLKYVSAEDVNAELIDKYITNNPSSNKTDAFHKTRSEFKIAYIKKVQSIFEEIKNHALEHFNDEKEGKKFIVYFDKNHPLNVSTQFQVVEKLRNISKCPNLMLISINTLHREIVSTEPFCLREKDYSER